MRRVYTIFAARLVSSSVTLNIALFAVALTVFREVVWVDRVLQTLASMPLSAFPQFFLNTIMRGELVTLTALGVMIFTAFSVQWKIIRPRLPAWHKAAAVKA